MLSSIELFLFIWVISGQYSCEIEDYGTENSAPLLIKGETESGYIVKKEFQTGYLDDGYNKNASRFAINSPFFNQEKGKT